MMPAENVGTHVCVAIGCSSSPICLDLESGASVLNQSQGVEIQNESNGE